MQIPLRFPTELLFLFPLISVLFLVGRQRHLLGLLGHFLIAAERSLNRQLQIKFGRNKTYGIIECRTVIKELLKRVVPKNKNYIRKLSL